MNFTSGGTEQETLDIEQAKLFRQQEWEEARTREQKLPENKKPENYDPRSLFERLQEQKDKKQDDFDEKMKFKNQILFLDNDEVEFLEQAARDEEERDAVKWQEEVDAVKAFREQVTSREEKQATAFNAGADSQGATQAQARAATKKKERVMIGALVKPKSAAVVQEAKSEGQKRPSPSSEDHSITKNSDGADAEKKARLSKEDEKGGVVEHNTDTDNENRSVATSILAMYGSDSEEESLSDRLA